MKKMISMILLGLMVMALLAGCKPQTEKQADKKPLQIVTTIFPEYDWVKNIIGSDNKDVEVTMLLDNGVDLHSYQPTADDIIKISTCDLFIYVGGESDEWVDDVLKNAANKEMKVINLLDVLGDSVKVEELVEGMEEGEHEHHHGKEVSTFEDDEVQDRALSDWAGKWQSAYPYALDGTLDKAFEKKAESGKMTAEEYKAYYQAGYKTDISSVEIQGDKITYTYENGETVSANYKYVGYFIQDWSTGTRAAMYRFESTDLDSKAPKYIEFNDHMIEQESAEHFHLRMSDESFDAIVDPENSWPTFFPAELTGEEICEEFMGHDHSEENDEHVWLSLRNAQVLCASIASTLAELDGDNADYYFNNVSDYAVKLAALDLQYQSAVDNAENKTVLFGDRFPFRYLVDDYGLSYYAAFAGCSAETEASFETVSFLAQKVDELKLPVVLTLEGTDHKIAETVVNSTQDKMAQILSMDSMQSTTSADIAGGATYLGIMEKNLDVLKTALK